MSKFTADTELANAVCEALGLDPARVESITLEADANGRRFFSVTEHYTVPATLEALNLIAAPKEEP